MSKSAPSDLLDKFALYLKLDRGLSANTLEAYRADVAAFLSSSQNKPLENLSRQDVQIFLERLANQGTGQRSRSRKLSALRVFFAFACAENFCELDPTTDLQAPCPSRTLPRTLALDDIEGLLAAPIAAGHFGDSVMLRVLYAAGLRVSELISLESENVDTQLGVVRVQGKGGKIRIVPIDPDTAALVERYRAEIRPALATRTKSEPTALFLSNRGTAFTRQGFWKLIKKYALAAGIAANVSPHVLRHAFATHLLERGMNLRSLQMLLGHSDISTTEIYSHVSNSHLHEALKKHHPRSKT